MPKPKSTTRAKIFVSGNYSVTRKGIVSEIISKALYHDVADRYLVGYLDFDTVKKIALPEFLKMADNFEAIPATRIVYIKREDNILYSRSNKKDSDIV